MADQPILSVEGLNVYYGHAHVLQGVSLTLDHGVLAVVGRNGMGKTTLCNAIMGLVPAAQGVVRLAGQNVLGLAPNLIVGKGIGYVPQGRRVWPSLTVDEHLRLALRGTKSPWTVQRIYEVFPRLAERKRNGGAQLSGGEQQMLAIGRGLLSNPRLLIMDEPTEGLAPVIVEQVALMLKRLAGEGEISVLLIEQNLGVATDVSDRVAVMVNGRIARTMAAAELAADIDLQQRLLGVRQMGDANEEIADQEISGNRPVDADNEPIFVYQVRRSAAPEEPIAAPVATEVFRLNRALTRWDAGAPLAQEDASPSDPPQLETSESSIASNSVDAAKVFQLSIAASVKGAAYIAGTFDTKGRELLFIKNCLDRLGLRTVTVDLSTTQKPSSATVSPGEVARCHPQGAKAVFTNDRGSAVTQMAVAFEHFIATRRDVGGLISAGGSGGTALATPAMRRLPIGAPKMMVSTVASGDVQRYVGPSDICMMYSVTDVSGINRISEQVLSNAAHALAGMIANGKRESHSSKPAVGLTMFGVTTPCVQAVSKQLENDFDCLTFHATGTGGQSMEKLVDSGLLTGVLDITTTEVADELVGGVFGAGPDRFGAIIRSKIPYVGSCGALDMVNFHAMDTIPQKFKGRNLYVHNSNVTLMRTTPEENTAMGKWIAERLNRMDGPVRFLIPEGGVSMLDAPGKPFWDAVADNALFSAIENTFKPAANRRLVRLPHNVNDAQFSDALVKHFLEIVKLPAFRAIG